MSNPNDAVGTNGAYGGRTSVEAFNDVLAVLNRGIVSGWECTPNSGLTVSLGGDGTTRDVAIAEDNAGNRTTINNISGSPIDVTMSAAPGNNSRIDLVVAYVDNPPQGVSTVADNPSACGIIKVTGVASSSPVPPNDSAIRTAITGDGASGATAFYVILAYITIPSGTTNITSSNISAGDSAGVSANNINFSSLGRHFYSDKNFSIGTADTLVDSYVVPSDGDYLICISASSGLVYDNHALYGMAYLNSSPNLLGLQYTDIPSGRFGCLTLVTTGVGCTAGDTIKVYLRDSKGISADPNNILYVSIVQISQS